MNELFTCSNRFSNKKCVNTVIINNLKRELVNTKRVIYMLYYNWLEWEMNCIDKIFKIVSKDHNFVYFFLFNPCAYLL